MQIWKRAPPGQRVLSGHGRPRTRVLPDAPSLHPRDGSHAGHWAKRAEKVTAFRSRAMRRWVLSGSSAQRASTLEHERSVDAISPAASGWLCAIHALMVPASAPWAQARYSVPIAGAEPWRQMTS
jgi:hypothetical protein